MTGTLPQSISGSFSDVNALNNLEINNVNDVTVLNDIEIDRELQLNNGLITIPTNSLFRLNYGAFVTPALGTPLSFVNGTLTKEMITGNSFTFPIGNYVFTKAHGPISLLNVSGPTGLNDWKATYFYANAELAGYSMSNFLSPISTVSKSEYWKIQAPTGGQATISIILDGSSDVGSTIPDLNNLRVVGWNGATSRWEIVGNSAIVSGINTNGTVTTTSPVNFGSYSYFTLASITPLSLSSASFTSPAMVNLCNGTSTTLVVAFSGLAPWVLTYKVGSTTTITPVLTSSPYSIVVTPSYTTSYTLTGITANGIPGTVNGTTAVTVNVSPIPTVVISSNDADNTVCQSVGVVFNATAGLANYKFRLNGVIVQNSASNIYSTSNLPVGIQSIDVIGSNTGGCSSTSSALIVTVNPLPSSAQAITGSPSTCKAVSGTYSIPAIGDASSYIWSYSGSGTTISGVGTSVTLTFTNNATSGNLTVYGHNSCGNGISSTLAINVSSGAAVSQKQNISTGATSVCKGSTAATYTVPLITNATGYRWFFSNSGVKELSSGTDLSVVGGVTTGTNSITLSFSSTAQSGNLTVQGISGCPLGDGPLSDNYAIAINAPPTATITPASSTGCSSTPISLTATPSGGTSPYVYLWTGSGASSLSSTTSTATTFSNGTGGSYDLSFKVTDNMGCYGTVSATIFLNQAPIANAGLDALGICTGLSPIQLTGATASGSYTGSPIWSGSGGTWTQNPDPALATFTPSTPSGSTTATLTLTGANGCSNVSGTRTISWNKVPDQPQSFTVSTAIVCQGQTNVIYTVPNDPLATSYAWSYTVGTGATIMGSGNNITMSFSSVSTSGKLIVTASNACGTSAIRTMDITVNSERIWTGAISTDWNDSRNWSCEVIPTLTTLVLIPNVANQPVLNTGPVGTSKNIVVYPGSSLTVLANTLQIAGTITNNGTFTATAGTIEMKGSAPQTIPANVFSGNRILNLNIDNVSGVTLQGPLNVTGIVEAINGNLSSSGNLTLVSTLTQSALISGVGNGEILGNVNMQRYLPSAFGYKYFSSPFQAATVGEFATEVDLSATFPTLYKYDENKSIDSSGVTIYSSGWEKYVNQLNPLVPLNGHAVNFGALQTPKTVELTGVVSNRNLNITLFSHNRRYTKGFNLVGNPYPSPIDWNNPGWTKTNIDNAIYFFNAGNTSQYSGVYSSYVNGVSTGNANNVIASMQGFFVHVTDGSFPVSATLGTTNAVRIKDLNPLFKNAIIEDRPVLSFTANFETKEAIEDVAVIYFDNKASQYFEKELDALKMKNTDLLVPNLYTITPKANQLSINGMPSPGDSIARIPLGFSTLSDGWINFKAKDISQLPSGLHLYLLDAQSGLTQDLHQNPYYRFFLKSGEINQRFSLVFSKTDLLSKLDDGRKMFTLLHSGNHLSVKVDLPFNIGGTLIVTNMKGQVLIQKNVFEMETVELNVNLSSGVYIITLFSGVKKESEKILMRKDYE